MARKKAARRKTSVLVVTTDQVEGRRVKKYIDLVAGEALLGGSAFDEHLADKRDPMEGGAVAFAKELHWARTIATDELREAAGKLGANAVVAARVQYEDLGSDLHGPMLLISISGTAVVLE